MQPASWLGDVQGDATGGPLRATLRVERSHPVLAGHFPGAPLVPGVLLLEAVVAAWERITGIPQRLAAIDDVRWTAPLSAEADAVLDAAVVVGAAGVCVQGQWRTPAARLGSFTVQLAPRG